ncbi:polysaccharide biosynthesis protein [Bacteroidales bacterium]|nr:polysaccharide biosynthesis protein [Bacteroidales bacterium]
MSGMKSLAKDAAIYGGSSIVGKTLNWLLTALYAYTFHSQGEFGIMTNLYAFAALMIVVLTFGMETGLFRFANKKDGDNKNEYDDNLVYSTTLIAVGTVVLIFLVLALIFLKPLAIVIDPRIPQNYILLIIIVLSIDAFACIPFAYLRHKKRPLKFASLKLLFIALYILLNLFFLLLCPKLLETNPSLVNWFYSPNQEVAYVLIANLIATLIQSCFLIPELTGFKYRFDRKLLNKMLKYSLPLLILGIAGMLNQTADKIIFPRVYPDQDEAFVQLGIYSACFKIAVVMVMFTQAFRYAYEPFIFGKNKDKDDKKAYADAMKYFIIFGLAIFLGVMFYMDIIKYFVAPSYYDGLPVVPIVMMGELFFGIYFNLSLWYKLTDKTHWGAIFSIIGCLLIVAINIIFIPIYGFMACAWASFIGNFLIMTISYFVGQKKFPVAYDLKTIGLYFGLSLALYYAFVCINLDNVFARLALGSCLFLIYVAIALKRDVKLGAYFSKKSKPIL